MNRTRYALSVYRYLRILRSDFQTACMFFFFSFFVSTSAKRTCFKIVGAAISFRDKWKFRNNGLFGDISPNTDPIFKRIAPIYRSCRPKKISKLNAVCATISSRDMDLTKIAARRTFDLAVSPGITALNTISVASKFQHNINPNMCRGVAPSFTFRKHSTRLLQDKTKSSYYFSNSREGKRCTEGRLQFMRHQSRFFTACRSV